MGLTIETKPTSWGLPLSFITLTLPYFPGWFFRRVSSGFVWSSPRSVGPARQRTLCSFTYLRYRLALQRLPQQALSLRLRTQCLTALYCTGSATCPHSGLSPQLSCQVCGPALSLPTLLSSLGFY